ncbi:hypothetical protein AB5J72_43920 [Streptomyces sp. CG1]|uniref:hypothetical protein n=1 Tax=Streptomyces sp. CG1 TaxID=1287523 RepID=UPI0034E1ADB8
MALASGFSVLCPLAARRSGVALPGPGTPGLGVHPLRVPVRRGVHAVYRTGPGGQPGTCQVLGRPTELVARGM